MTAGGSAPRASIPLDPPAAQFVHAALTAHPGAALVDVLNAWLVLHRGITSHEQLIQLTAAFAAESFNRRASLST